MGTASAAHAIVGSFAGGGLAGAAFAQGGEKKRSSSPDGAPPATSGGKTPAAGGKMPMRLLGKTGVEVSLVGLGGYHIGSTDEKTAVRLVRTAIDHGVTFMDNCWDYNEGKSHVWMGHALRDGYRKRVFLMTKIDGRTRKPAAEQIDQSLRDLETDVIDLMQLHEVIRASDVEQCFAPGGAFEALQAAQKAGKIRFIGFTGHKSPDLHLAMLDAAAKRGISFDAVQMPLNVMDAHYDSFERRVLPALKRSEIAPLAMKPLGGGVLFKSPPVANKKLTPTQCLHYAMNLPVATVITGCDSMEVLMQAIDAARRFQPLSEEEVKRLLAHTAPAAQKGAFEKYKTSSMFDGTARNPHWLTSSRL